MAVGVDVSSVERVRQLLTRQPRFATKYFSAEEAAYSQGRPERLAARWAAKEAVRKLFGGLGRPLPLYSAITVRRRPGGAPQVLVEGEVVAGLSISLTHDAGVGVAVAALAGGGDGAGGWLGELPTDLELPQRPARSHKGTFGTVLVVAGSGDFPGAAVLCSLGALRGGSGKVKAVVVAGSPGSAGLPAEVIRVPVTPSGPGLDRAALEQAAPALESAQAVVCGPGLGQGAATEGLLDALFAAAAGSSWGLVLDADALNVCASQPPLRARIPRGSVLTPHPLEAARLAGRELAEVQASRSETARSLAAELGVVVVLKGAETVVADPAGALYVDGHATAALASGGTGDVLAGLVGALRAQGLGAFSAARAGVFLHGAAGQRLAMRRGRAGILASEVAAELVEVQEAVRRRRER